MNFVISFSGKGDGSLIKITPVASACILMREESDHANTLEHRKRSPRTPIVEWTSPVAYNPDGSFEYLGTLDCADIKIQTILTAIREDERVVFLYSHHSSIEGEWREVAPGDLFRVQCVDNEIYLRGYCHLRKANRTFRIDRMHCVTPLRKETFFCHD